MKWFIASDLHGSAAYCEQMLAAYAREGADRLVLLGDILYHGPRNDLPEGYAPKAVIAALNPLKEQILCVRGNCDTEVDQMVLEFPILADYAVLADGGLTLYLTHGHKFGEQNPPPMPKGSVLLCGHTHIPAWNVHEDFIYVNPGSVSIPKNGSHHGYMLLENGVFTWKDLEGNTIREERI
ncbi:MAG: phosphodiesterase [Clostridia bacterium]|nr:phosphodiesterase [Clostridia bacterium]